MNVTINLMIEIKNTKTKNHSHVYGYLYLHKLVPDYPHFAPLNYIGLIKKNILQARFGTLVWILISFLIPYLKTYQGNFREKSLSWYSLRSLQKSNLVDHNFFFCFEKFYA